MSGLTDADKKGLFWDGGFYAADRAKPQHKAEARRRVTRGQGMGALKGAVGGAAGGTGIGASVGRLTRIPGATVAGAGIGAYTGAIGGTVAGASHGGKKAFKELQEEKKIKKNLGSVSAFGIQHG